MWELTCITLYILRINCYNYMYMGLDIINTCTLSPFRRTNQWSKYRPPGARDLITEPSPGSISTVKKPVGWWKILKEIKPSSEWSVQRWTSVLKCTTHHNKWKQYCIYQLRVNLTPSWFDFKNLSSLNLYPWN